VVMFRGKDVHPVNIVEVQFKFYVNDQSFSVIKAGNL
jgi:hypothetical protein